MIQFTPIFVLPAANSFTLASYRDWHTLSLLLFRTRSDVNQFRLGTDKLCPLLWLGLVFKLTINGLVIYMMGFTART